MYTQYLYAKQNIGPHHLVHICCHNHVSYLYAFYDFTEATERPSGAMTAAQHLFAMLTMKAAWMKRSIAGRSSRGRDPSRGANASPSASPAVGMVTVLTRSQFSSISMPPGPVCHTGSASQS